VTKFLTSEATQIVEQAARHSIPTVYGMRLFAVAGGLASYGASLAEANQSGRHLCRKKSEGGQARGSASGPERPSLSWSSNLKTANALGLTVPQSLLARADEVIE